MSSHFICGDIGGTKALLGLAAIADGQPRLVFRRRYECAHFVDFGQLFSRFHDEAKAHARMLAGGCLAVAGPVDDDGLSAKITNLPWTVDATTCGAAFALPPLRLVNDFAAAATGIAVVEEPNLVTLQRGAALARGIGLVIGAGTGLGMAVRVPAGTGYDILPGEGGHAGFSPQDETQARIHAALLAVHGRVTWERVVSGPGLSAIHRLLAGENLDAATITAQATRDAGSSARQSVDVFLAAYGAFAGDMALAVMARGGVFLAGGIVTRVLPLMASSPFLTAFRAKAEHAALAARMPIHAITDPDLGLKGAALLAWQGIGSTATSP